MPKSERNKKLLWTHEKHHKVIWLLNLQTPMYKWLGILWFMYNTYKFDFYNATRKKERINKTLFFFHHCVCVKNSYSFVHKLNVTSTNEKIKSKNDDNILLFLCERTYAAIIEEYVCLNDLKCEIPTISPSSSNRIIARNSEDVKQVALCQMIRTLQKQNWTRKNLKLEIIIIFFCRFNWIHCLFSLRASKAKAKKGDLWDHMRKKS